MQNGAFRRALGLVFLYCCLFVLIVLVQFSKGPGISEKIGPLAVSASYPRAVHGKAGTTPVSLRLSFSGLAFLISPKSVAESVDTGGATTTLALASIGKIPNGISIQFSSGVELRAVVDKGPPDRFGISVSAPDGIAEVRVRLAPASSTRFLEENGQRRIEMKDSSYEVSLSESSLDEAAGFISLRPGDTGLALQRISSSPPKQDEAAAPERLVAQAPKEAEAFKAEIAAWRDEVWSGLSSTRFDPDKITWKGLDGLPGFSEKALTAYLAESLARGTFQDSLSRVRGAKDKWRDDLSYLSAPYLGDLVRKMSALQVADLAESKRLAQLVADNSPSIFEKDGLLSFLLDRGPASLAQGAFKYFAGVDPSKLTIGQAVGYLGCALDGKSLLGLKDEDNPCRAASAAAESIVAAARAAPNGFVLVTEADGSSDIRTCLLAGRLLVAYGTAKAKPAIVGVGQGLVEGVWGLSDAQGFAPARVVVRGATIEQRIGAIAPEELYSLVADNPYYPHEVSFYRDIMPGFWAWTCSPSLVVQANSARYVFTAAFPAGRSHYLTFYGVKPFTDIQLYDIDYSPDNEFESYDASGYLYKKEMGSLYIKMKHKKDQEDIKLLY